MKPWYEIFNEERKQRESLDSSKLCTYGLSCLDDSLKFIMPNDLVVIGADSGYGKSELAIKIAINNVKNGKKVALYFLEGGEHEAMSRIKWRLICDEFFSTDEYKYRRIDLDYVSWKTNTNPKMQYLKEIEDKVLSRLLTEWKDRFWFYEIENGIDINNLVSSLYEFHSLEKAIKETPFSKGSGLDLDLIVIDHLQYFELTNEGSEIQETTRILKEVNKITTIFNTPVILVSHLRKKNKDRGLPDQEDFYGTSNTAKIASVAITIASDTSSHEFSKNIFPTYFRIVKSRIGIRSNYCMKINFDMNTRNYSKEYNLYAVNRDGLISKEPILADNLPKWAIKKQEEDWQ